MANKKQNKSKNEKDKVYSSYNQITKEYDVCILSEDEYNHLSPEEQKEVKYMILKPKTGINPGPPKPPVWFDYWVEHGFIPTIADVRKEIVEIKQEMIQVKQDVAELNRKVDALAKRVDNIVKLNNLKE